MLRVHTDLPAGNARILSVDTAADIPEIHFAAAPAGAPEAIWFCFGVTPPTTGAPAHPIRCVLHFYETLLGNQPGSTTAGFHPVFRTAHRGWTRLDTVTTHEQSDGQRLVSWEIPGDEGEIAVALAPPYGSTELERLLADTTPSFQTAAIGLTGQGVELVRLHNQPGSPGGDAPGFYCLARQHAAETPGSWVLDGLLREFAATGPDAPLVWTVPFVDHDGVAAGRSGKDSYPWDFNRSWGSKLFPPETHADYGTHPMRHEVKCLQHDLRRWQSRCRPQLVLDFHAPVTCYASGIFCYLCDLDPDGHPDAAHAPWVNAIAAALDPRMRQGRFIQSGRYPSRWNTARVGDFVTRALNLPLVTIEVPYARSPRMLFDVADYQTAGRQIAQALLRTLPAA